MIKEFKQGHHVLVEGDEADGFYILLSGHLAVGTEGRFIGELSEGDVFGEVGLLEGATREATVTVVSADAEVLFMSTRSFQHLLHTVPAFAWGIWDDGGRPSRPDSPPVARCEHALRWSARAGITPNSARHACVPQSRK